MNIIEKCRKKSSYDLSTINLIVIIEMRNCYLASLWNWMQLALTANCITPLRVIVINTIVLQPSFNYNVADRGEAFSTDKISLW